MTYKLIIDKIIIMILNKTYVNNNCLHVKLQNRKPALFYQLSAFKKPFTKIITHFPQSWKQIIFIFSFPRYVY